MTKNQKERLKKVAELYRKSLFPKANLPKGKLEWHHQNNTASNKKVSQASSCTKAFEEISDGFCIPLTHKEHRSVHPEPESQNWSPRNFPRNSKKPTFDKNVFDKIKKTVMSKKAIKDVKSILSI